jgi:hypothetical protein
MGNPLPVLSAILQANYTPKRLAQGIDAQGNYVDANGKPTSYYEQPGWWQRALNPVAQQNVAYNTEVAGQPLQMQRARALQRQMSGLDYNTLTPEQQALFPNEQNAITTTGGDFRGNSLLGQGTDLARINNGLPQATASADYNTELARQLQGSNAAKQAAMSGLLGNPTLSAGVENQGLNYQSGEYAGNTALQPQKFYNQGMGLGNEQMQLEGQRAALPNENQQLYNQSLIGSTTSGQGVTDLPYTTRQMQNEAVSGLVGSKYTPLGPIVGNRINPDGTITPHAINPLGGNAQLLGMQHMTDGMQSQQPVVTQSGNAYLRPVSNINPLNDYSTDNKGTLYRGGVPVDDNDKDTHNFTPENNAHKPLTTGQRLLQGIYPTIASGGVNPNSRSAMLNAHNAINQRAGEQQRIQQLTSILTNPPKQNAGKAGIVSVYTHDQLQNMADELDKLLGE